MSPGSLGGLSPPQSVQFPTGPGERSGTQGNREIMDDDFTQQQNKTPKTVMHKMPESSRGVDYVGV